MTKAQLLKALEPYPDDIVITVADPYSFEEMSSWPISYEPIGSVDAVSCYGANMEQRGNYIQLSVY